MIQKIRWFLLILVIVLTLAAITQNGQETTVQLLWLTRTMPLSVLLLSTIAVGFLLGALTTALMLRRRHKAKEAAKSKKATEPTKPATKKQCRKTNK